MKKIFFVESKLTFLGDIDKPENVDLAANGTLDRTYEDTKEAQQVMQEQSKLKAKLADSNIFTDEDKRQWEKRLQEAERKTISTKEMQQLKQEFEQQQGQIKGMVEGYTDKVMSNKEAAFTIDQSRGLDTAKEYIEWFAQQSHQEKQKALGLINTDISERVRLRKRLLEKMDKTEVVKLRRSEMKDKVKEIESMEKNEKTYENKINAHLRLFHNPTQYLKEFRDQTVEEQERWLRVFEAEIVKPRKELVDIYDKLPAKYKNDEKFLKVGLKEKRTFLEKLDAGNEQKYIKDVNSVKPEIMSQNSKRFAIVDFLNLSDVAQKAMWLEQLPKSIEAEEKLTKDYKKAKKNLYLTNPETRKKVEIKGYNEKDWEKLKFEEKEQMLNQMNAELKLVKPFDKTIKEALKNKSISKKTASRYIELYTGITLAERSNLCRNILTSMKVRRELLEDFEKLNNETQKRYGSFYERGHKARLKIYREAILYESKNKKEDQENSEKKDTEETEKTERPLALESDDIREIINELHEEADKLEAQGEYERCIDKHNYVLKLHPDNEYSLKKRKELKDDMETMDGLMDEDILTAVENQVQSEKAQEELKQIQISQKVLQDQEENILRNSGVQDKAKQTSHLSDGSFDKRVHQKVYEKSQGKQILDKNGELKAVRNIDLSGFGQENKAESRKLRQQIDATGANQNLSDIQFHDSLSGRKLKTNEVKDQLDTRKTKLAKSIAKRINGLKPEEAEQVLSAAAEYVEEELAA